MFKEKEEKKIQTPVLGDPDEMIPKNGLEEKTDQYKEVAIGNINFTVILKPAIISFVALIISFFLDLSTVPLLGNVTVDIAKELFPTWQPVNDEISPYSFWWLPVATYILFVLMSFLAYVKLKEEVKRTPASETIDRIITSYTSVIDSIATALPLIGAAILLISIKLGEEVFLGLSVPFEIKALIVLALGKLFEPVLDQLGVEFQNVVNHLKDFREKYFSRLQLEYSKNLLKKLDNVQAIGAPNGVSAEDLESYKNLLEHSAKLSSIMQKNYASIHSMLENINSASEKLSPEKIAELKELANSISQASSALSDEKTISGLSHLDSIVNKK